MPHLSIQSYYIQKTYHISLADFFKRENLSRYKISSQCFVWGNISTGTAFTGTNGSPKYCFEFGLAKSTRFLIAALGSHAM